MDVKETKVKRWLRKYLLNYFIVFALIVLACCPFIYQTYQLTRQNVIKQANTRLSEGMGYLDNTLENIYSTGLIISQHEDIRKMIALKGAVPRDYYVNMSAVKKDIINLYMLGNEISTAFILFPQNDAFISNVHIAEDFSEYLGSFLVIDEKGADEIREHIFSTNEIFSFIPTNEMRYYNDGKFTKAENPLLCSIKISSTEWINNARFSLVVMLDREQILEWFLPEELRDLSAVKIQDKNGNTIFDSMSQEESLKESGKWEVITTSGEDSGVSASVFIPTASILSPVVKSIEILARYTFGGLLLAIIIMIYLSYRQYRPIKGLADVAYREEIPNGHKENEFEYIEQVLTGAIMSKNEYKYRLEQMEADMKNSTLEKLMLRGVSTRSEMRQIEEYLGSDLHGFCVASLEIMDKEDASRYSAVMIEIQNYLHENIDGRAILIPSGLQEVIILLQLPSDKSSSRQEIRTLLENLVYDMEEKFHTITNIGIGTIQDNLQKMAVSYAQAFQTRQAYRDEMTNVVASYKSRPDQTLNNYMNIEAIQRMKNYLLSGDRAMIEQQIDAIAWESRKAATPFEMHKQQIFYSFRHMLWCVMEDLGIPEDRIALPSFMSSWKDKEMMQVVKNSCFQICDYTELNKKSRNLKLKQEVVAYLNQEYTRCDLNAITVCQKLGISEKYLYQFIKEQTGKTFMNYVEELRIQKAEELLLLGKYNNVEIAEASGFGSVNTLYRMFNKYKGMPPMAYKKLMSEGVK